MTRFIGGLVDRIDRIWNSIGARLNRSGRLRHVGLAAIITMYVGVETVRQSLDRAVLKVHRNGLRGVSANSLHDGEDAAAAALTLWREAEIDLKDFVKGSGRSVALYQTLAELLLVPFTFVVFYGLTKWLRGRVSGAQRAALLFSSAAVPLYAGLGVFNQLVELWMISHDKASWVAVPLQWSSAVRSPSKWLILIPVFAVLAPSWRTPFRWFRNAGSAYRVLIVVAVVHALLLVVSTPAEQTRDALRLWLDKPALAMWGFLATSVFATLLAALALRLSGTHHGDGGVLNQRQTIALFAVGIALIAAGVGLRSAGWGSGMTALGVVLAVVAGLSFPVLSLRDGQVPEPLKPAGRQTLVTVPAALAMSPMLALTHALAKTAVPSFIDDTSAGWLVVGAFTAGGLSVFAYWAARTYGGWLTSGAAAELPERRRRGFWAVTLVPASVGLLIAAWVVADPWERAGDIGVVGLLSIFLVLLVVGTGLLSYAFEGRPVPAALEFVSLRRVPVVGLIVAWAVVGNLLPDDRFHAVRTVQSAGPVQISVEEAFGRWVDANIPEETPAPGTRTGTPIVFVMAAGGGIKAAAFTASTLECLFASLDPNACALDDVASGEPLEDRWSRVFAASGASGGSVGIASMKAQSVLGGTREDWVQEQLGTDLLSPELAWQLFVETPNTLLTFNTEMDRAEVLERTWEREFAEDPDGNRPAAAPFFAGLPADGWNGPMLFLNGTNLIDGCRVNVSLADPEMLDDRTGVEPEDASSTYEAQPGEPTTPGTSSATDGDCRRRRTTGPVFDQTVSRNLADYLCDGTNIPLSTAAFLSARFPVVSPAGEVVYCEKDDAALAIGDGGYRDNTGAAAISDVWATLEPLIDDHNRTNSQCIVPVLLEIDNGYANRGASLSETSLYQLTAPLTGILSVVGTRDAGPIEALTAEFSKPTFGGVTAELDRVPQTSRFFRVSLYGHPGVTAPLGWSLSASATTDITKQLDKVASNQDTGRELLRWLHGGVTCA